MFGMRNSNVARMASARKNDGKIPRSALCDITYACLLGGLPTRCRLLGLMFLNFLISTPTGRGQAENTNKFAGQVTEPKAMS